MVGSKYRYCFTICDNGRGNKTKTSVSDRYNDLHKDLKYRYIICQKAIKKNRYYKSNNPLRSNDGSSDQKKIFIPYTRLWENRWYLTGNYYTRHILD